MQGYQFKSIQIPDNHFYFPVFKDVSVLNCAQLHRKNEKSGMCANQKSLLISLKQAWTPKTGSLPTTGPATKSFFLKNF